MEYAAAVAILKSGPSRVRHNIEIKPRRGVRTEGELDLVVNWGGHLWVVDCKDRASDSLKVDNIRREIEKQQLMTPGLRRQIDGLEKQMEAKQVKTLREDMQQAYESAGIMARVICVRAARLPQQAEEYARSRGIHMVNKDSWVPDFRRIFGSA